jgi:hypothetical protein
LLSVARALLGDIEKSKPRGEDEEGEKKDT